MRETIHRIFSAQAAGEAPSPPDLGSLNRALPRALSKLRVEIDPSGCCWIWAPREDALDSPLWPVLRSAADLLTSADAERVRECASETCRWLFLDRSRPGNRRWCDMKTCGNRAKARRHYRRRKTRAASGVD
jgi:predicted RNA-binding Zn ribbon-like protein